MPTLRKLSLSEVEITLTNESELDDPADQIDDAESVAWVREQRNAGNEWAWCCAIVTVRWNGFEANECLGGCSYKSGEDFRDGPYFADLCNEALGHLNAEIASAYARLAELVEAA